MMYLAVALLAYLVGPLPFLKELVVPLVGIHIHCDNGELLVESAAAVRIGPCRSHCVLRMSGGNRPRYVIL